MTVLDVLSGASGPLTLDAIGKAADMRYRRDVESEVQRLRLAGYPILSSSAGIWLSASPDEVRRGARALRKRAITQLVTARSLRRTAERMPAQLTVFGDLP